MTHLAVTVTALAVVTGLAIPAAPLIRASLDPVPRVGSILPANLGVGVATTAPVVLEFPAPMDRAAVAHRLGVAPRTDFTLLWSADGSQLAIVPASRWATDERYVIHIPAGTARADGGRLAADWRAAFTTQTAPRITDLQVTGVAGSAVADVPQPLQDDMAADHPAGGLSAVADDEAPDVSTTTAVGLTFSAAMDGPATEAAFRITPAVAGSFSWAGTTLWFVPEARLVAGARYAISLTGARDADGNRLGGDTSFSFTTRPGAQAVTVDPAIGARGVTVRAVRIGFSQPMDTVASGAAFVLAGSVSGQRVAGQVTWSTDAQTLTFTPRGSLLAGRTYVASLRTGARDADGNPVTISWRFTTAGGTSATRSFSPVPASPGSSDSVQYALNQINAARASYGFAPLTLDPAISAVAYGHAADMLANGYFSHDSLDGTTYKQRLTAGGISYGYSGENMCYLRYGGGVQATLDWCHAQFWAEPYPGYANHKSNILSPNFRRVGIGIAVGGERIIVVWDFTD